jgi:hypothetical protein
MRRFLCTAATALTLVLLAGCGSDSDSSSGAGSAAAASGAAAPGAPAAVPGTSGEAAPDRQVVQTGTVTVAVEDPAAGSRRVSELVEAAGGRVDQRTEQAATGDDGDDGGRASADLVVRVPSDALTGVLADLDELGDVGAVSVSRSDVTATAVDLDARISALQTSATRLQGLMDGAASTADLLAAEKALSERQGELESLQSRRAALADQVELSTLTVHLEPFGVAPVGGPDGFLEALGTGWWALLTTLGAAFVVLGVVLPWVVLAALLTAAVLVPLRLVRRRAAAAVPPPA